VIDPIIFTIKIGTFQFSLHWYGVIVMLGVSVAAWLSGREVKRRGGDVNWIWDSLFYILIAGVIGARLWYVAVSTIGGNPQYLQNPLSIFNIPAGGLHIYGAFLFGGIAFLIYARRQKLDLWLLIDSIAPNLLIGQAIGRIANFINQELYGPPTTLPWGIPIDAQHRLPMYQDLSQFPEATTRFHPTFAYEMVWNILAATLLVWIGRKFERKIRPGTIFFGWMVLAGLGRAIIETWRPDQPILAGIGISTSRLVALLLFITGGILLLSRYHMLPFSFWKDQPELELQSEAERMDE